MPETPPRRFSLADAMILIAAITPGLILIRVGANLGIFDLGSLREKGGQESPLGRQLVEFLSVGGGSILAGLVPTVLILGLYRAHPSRRDALQGPGLIACLVAVAAAILPIIWFTVTILIDSRSFEPMYSTHVNNGFARWMVAAGPMILGAWIALFLVGRWRPKPTWTDRAGCILGACFVLIYLYAEIYFVVRLIVRLWEK